MSIFLNPAPDQDLRMTIMQHPHYGPCDQTHTGSKRIIRCSALSKRLISAAILATASLSISACQQQRAAMTMPVPEVEVAAVTVQDVPITKEWVGTLDGRVNAQIRAQVSGYLMKQNYTEGSFVRAGQLLFEIDPRPFQAALNLAKGSLAQAEGNLRQAHANLAMNKARLGKTDLDVKRYTPLAKTRAISQEE